MTDSDITDTEVQAGEDILNATTQVQQPSLLVSARSPTQKVTLALRGVTSATKFGLRAFGPEWANRTGKFTNRTGIGNTFQGEITPLGRVGGGLGALSGGFGMYSSLAGIKSSWDQGSKTGVALNVGNFASSTAYAVGGVAQVLGKASLASDATGVGVCIGVPLQVIGLGFQIHDVCQQSKYMNALMKERLGDEAAASHGSYVTQTGYVPGLPLKPEYADYRGLSNLRVELNAQKTEYAEGGRINLDNLSQNAPALDRLTSDLSGNYEIGVRNRDVALNDMKSFVHSSTVGQILGFVERHATGFDREKNDTQIMKAGEDQIAIGTASKAAHEELTAGAPSARDPGKLVGYDWRLKDYQSRLAPLEGDYPGQAAELNKLRDIHIGIQQDAHNPAQLERYVGEQARENVLAERQKVEAMDPAAQDAYFAKNKEFIAKAGIDPTRPDLQLVGLSASREEYNAKAVQFAPAVFADRAQVALEQNAATLATVNAQGAVYADRARALAQALPDVKPADLPIVDDSGKPVLKAGKPVTFRDAQDELAGTIKDAQTQLDALKKDPGAATGDADAKARVALQAVAVQSLQMQYANNENQNLAFQLQSYDEKAAALAQENASLYADMARRGLDKVPVTPDASMVQAEQAVTASRQAAAKETQALAGPIKDFDKTYGDAQAQAALLKKGDLAYIDALKKLQAMEFGIGLDEIKALKAENTYLKDYQALAQKEAGAPDLGGSHFVASVPQTNTGTAASAIPAEPSGVPPVPKKAPGVVPH